MLTNNNNENNKIHHHNNHQRRRTKNHKMQQRWEGVIFICTIFIFSVWFIAITILVSKLEENIQTNDPYQMSSNLLPDHVNLYMHPQHSLPKYPMNHRQNLKSSSSSQQRRPLTDQAISQCNKALWHTIQTTVYVLPHNETFVITGDIQDLWLRDSAAQIHPLLLPNIYNGKSLIQVDSRLERIVSGLILKVARFIRYDPYANAFKLYNTTKFSNMERTVLGRHGYIATWNYELDSGCYYMRLLYYFHVNFPNHPILHLKEVKEAVSIMIDVWIALQKHEDNVYPNGTLFDCYHCNKPYRYNPKELKRNGKGTPTNSSVGLTWSGFRPSDDPCVYGYLIPANMFAVVVLGYMEELSEVVWIDEPLMKRARQLKEEIDDGIQNHGIVRHETYGRIYAYEVDGLGNYLLMDDANVPSLLSIPYLGYKYDEQVFANTKRFLFSKANPWYHTGKSNGVEYSGIGSPHTKFIPQSIWPMAMIMEGLISKNATEKIILVEKLLTASAGKGWMHESFNPNNPKRYSREWFCWPDSLFAELVMSLTDACPRPEYGRYTVKEWRDVSSVNINGSVFAAPPTPPPTPKPTTASADDSEDESDDDKDEDEEEIPLVVVTGENLKNMDSPLIIFTCQRADYLRQTLTAVWNYHPANKNKHDGDDGGGGYNNIAYPIVISQDGENKDVRAVVIEFMHKFHEVGVPFIHATHGKLKPLPKNLGGVNGVNNAYRDLAVHYGWALNRLFDGTTYKKAGYDSSSSSTELPPCQRVIILEEDIKVAPDFFSFMHAMAPLLESDPTLLAVSAYNDNGKKGIVSNGTRVVRSDFFPGLGWMMNRRVWNEIGPKWPDTYWDDWFRNPEQRLGRQIIRPEVSRTFHFGTKQGASRNQFGKELTAIDLMEDEDIAWETKDGLYDYLERNRFRQDYYSSVLEAQPSPWEEAMQMVKKGNVRVEYGKWEQFKNNVKKIHSLISTDEKAGVPRSSFEGIVETRPYGEHLLFISPPAEQLKENFERGKNTTNISSFSESLRVVGPPAKAGCYYYVKGMCSSTKK